MTKELKMISCKTKQEYLDCQIIIQTVFKNKNNKKNNDDFSKLKKEYKNPRRQNYNDNESLTTKNMITTQQNTNQNSDKIINLNGINIKKLSPIEKQKSQKQEIQGKIDIVFQNLSYTVQVKKNQSQLATMSISCYMKFYKNKKDKNILKNVSGIFKSGRLSVIMGASGAGKTSLLNILACKVKPDEGGKVFANTLKYDLDNFGDFANYVTQQDILMSTLTVRETLQFAAKLKINKDQQEINEIVLEIVKQLKLQKCLDTLIGGFLIKGISGGERKRTSIAVQLISNPQVIFLDQPTSGLDSLTSFIIVKYLKKLATQKGKTVVMTIHQPNSQIFNLFDGLSVMIDGQFIYQGKASKIKKYFSLNFQMEFPQFSNISDYFMSKIHNENEQNRQKYPLYLQTYQNNQQSFILNRIEQKQTSQINKRISEVSFASIMSALLYRNILNLIRNPLLLKAKVLQGIFISLFVGGIYFDIGQQNYMDLKYWVPLKGFLFALTIGFLISSIVTIILTFPLERDVFYKERDSKMYNTFQYFLARNIIEIPQLIIVPMIWILIYYFMIDLAKTEEQFFLHFLISFLMCFCGSSLGLLLGCVLLDAKSVVVAAPLILIPFTQFSGFFKNRADLPVWAGWIEYISPNKYAFIGYLQNQIVNKPSLVSQLNFNTEKWEAVLYLFIIGIAFRIFAFICLWKSKSKIN